MLLAMAAHDAIERARAVFRGREDVHLALLFGSFARGQARDDSDLDVAVLGPGVDVLAIAAALRDATQREVDVVALEHATIPLLQALVDDAIVLHEGVPGAAAHWRFHAVLTLETDGPAYRRMSDAFIARLAASARPATGV